MLEIGIDLKRLPRLLRRRRTGRHADRQTQPNRDQGRHEQLSAADQTRSRFAGGGVVMPHLNNISDPFSADNIS